MVGAVAGGGLAGGGEVPVFCFLVDGSSAGGSVAGRLLPLLEPVPLPVLTSSVTARSAN